MERDGSIFNNIQHTNNLIEAIQIFDSIVGSRWDEKVFKETKEKGIKRLKELGEHKILENIIKPIELED